MLVAGSTDCSNWGGRRRQSVHSSTTTSRGNCTGSSSYLCFLAGSMLYLYAYVLVHVNARLSVPPGLLKKSWRTSAEL
jgi:hypothetical protein